MEPISEKQEYEIDDTEKFVLEDGTEIEGKNIMAYGEISLKNDEDINLINKLPIICEDIFSCTNIIPTTFDYNKGTIKGINPWSHIWDKLLWFKYNYCLIGKPKRIIIYKITFRKIR